MIFSIFYNPFLLVDMDIQGGPKSKPLQNYQKLCLIAAYYSANEIRFLRQIKEMIKHYNIIRRY